MQTIKAIFDGTEVKLLEPVTVQGSYEVLVVFVEPLKEKSSEPQTKETVSAKLPRSTAKGLLKDKIWMAPDFDEPLECMKEYME